MTDARKILVIGGGPAGVWAAISAKKQDPAAAVTLLSGEHCEPYEKPPLSKAVLTGAARIEEELVVTATGCEVVTKFPAEELLVAGRRLFTVNGPLPDIRSAQSNLNTPEGRGEK